MILTTKNLLNLAIVMLLLGVLLRATEPTIVNASNAIADRIPDNKYKLIHISPHQQRVLAALHMVEASGRLDPPDGDGGLSIGPLQICEAYWLDAITHNPDLGGDYEDCRELDYAKRVVISYWQRYNAYTPEKMARIHVGGPRGMFKECTIPYWEKVQKALEDLPPLG